MIITSTGVFKSGRSRDRPSQAEAISRIYNLRRMSSREFRERIEAILAR
jgi:hypothetical protein